MNEESIEILKNILINYGIEDADNIIEELEVNKISNNIPFDEAPLKISADNWLNSRGFDTEQGAGNYNHGLVFYPIKKDGKVNKFYMFNSATQNGETKVLDKINSFDVSDNNFIKKSTGRASVDSFALSERKYGYSMNSNKVSQTIGNVIDEQFTNINNLRTNAFKFKNEKMIEFGKNKIKKQNYDISQIKHLETFRVFSTLNELQTNFNQQGFIPDDLINNKFSSDSSLRNIINADYDNINVLKEQFKNINIFNPNTLNEQVTKAVKNNIINFKNFNIANNNLNFSNNKYGNVIEFDESFINEIIDKNNLIDKDVVEVNQYLLNKLGFESFAQEYAQKITENQKDFSFLENSNVNLAIYDEVMKQQRVNSIRGDYLNKQLNVNYFDKSQQYTIEQIQQLQLENNPDLDIYSKFKNTYDIKDNKVILNTPAIVGNKLTNYKLNLNISETEFKRYMNLNFRQDGNLLVEHFVNSGMNENQITTELNKMQTLIKQYQNGTMLTKNKVMSQFKDLKVNEDTKNLIFNTIKKGNDINVSNIVNRSQSMIKGNSQFFNHSIQGSLSAFNKLGARPWQSLETLDDVLINVSTNLENNETKTKKFNITKELIKQRAKLTDYIMDTDFIKNMNLRGLSNAENNFLNNNSIETRDSIKGLFFDSYGIYEGGKLKHGQLAYNESMYLNKGFSEVLQGKQQRIRDYTFEQLPSELQTKLIGIDDKNQIKNIFNEFTNNSNIEKRINLYETLPDEKIMFLNNSKLNNLKEFYKQSGTSSISNFSVSKAFLNKQSYLDDVSKISDSVLENMDEQFLIKYLNTNNYNQRIDLFNQNKDKYSFLNERLKLINSLNSFDDKYINLDDLSKESFKGLKNFQKQNRMTGLHRQHIERFNVLNVDEIKKDLLNLTYNKNKNDLGLDYRDSYIFKNIEFNKKTNTYSVAYDDITVGALGNKVHMNDGYKGTISMIADKMSFLNGRNQFDIAGINSSKSFSRGFEGSNLYSTLETSLWLSNKYGDKKLEDKLFNSLTKYEYGKDKNRKSQYVNLFDLLGLQINKIDSGYEIFDKNGGLSNYNDYMNLSKPDTINNPHLRSKIQSMKTINQLKKYGFHSLDQIDLIVNKIYEDTYKNKKGFIPIYGDKEITINDKIYRMAGKLSLKSLSITGANQNTPYENALKIDGLITRFFDTRGFDDIGNSIRSQINNRNTEFLSQLNYAFNDNSLNILKGKSIKLLDKNNVMNFNLNMLSDEVDLVNEILFGNSTFNEFVNQSNDTKINSSIIDNLPKGLRKQIAQYIQNIQDPNSIRSIPTITINKNDLSKLNKNISNTFNNKLSDLIINDRTTGLKLKNYYDSLKEFTINNQIGDIKKLNKNSQELLELLDVYKKNNKEIFGLSNIFESLLKTNDTGEISKIMNIIENPDKTLNYNFLTNGVFLDPKTNELNLNPIKSHIRNLMDLDSYNQTADIFKGIKKKLDNKELINLKKESELVNYVNGLKNKDFEKLTNLDIEILRFINKDSKSISSIEKYISNKTSMSISEANIDNEKLNKLKEIAQSDMNIIINNFKNTKSILIDNSNTVDDVLKNIASTEGKLFRNLYGINQFLKDNLTSKDSFMTDYISLRSKVSFSEQVAEGSSILNLMADKVTSELRTKFGDIEEFKKGQTYKDIVDLFGIETTKNVVLKDLFDSSNRIKNHTFDITKIENLKKQINSIESLSFVSKDNLERKAGNTFKELSKSLDDKNSFFGFLYRGPAQSSENIIPTQNYIIDSKNQNNNFIIEELNKQGFGKKGTSIMILGKETAARMKADNDGDKLYLSAIDDLLDSNIEKNKENIRLSVYMSNDRDYNDKRYKKFGFDVESKEYLKIKNYFKFYNSLNDVRTKENIDSHFHIAQMIFSDKDNRKRTMDLLATKNDKQRNTIFELISKDISLKTKMNTSDVKQQLADYFGLEVFSEEQTVKLKNKLVNPFDFVRMQEAYIKDTNVAKTGIVYTNANRVRNTIDVMAKMNLNEDTLDEFARSIAKLSGDEKQYNDILNKLNSNFNENFTKKDFINYINEIKNGAHKSSMAAFEAIEMGVISGKHGGVSIYEELERITNATFKGTKNFRFDELSKLNTGKITDDDLNKTKKLLLSLINSNVSEDKDLLKILGVSLDSKMYQEKALSKVLLSDNIENKKTIISKLTKKNVNNINLALGMTGEYANNVTRVKVFEQVVNSMVENTGLNDWYSTLRKSNPLIAIGKLLGIDIGRVTRDGNQTELNELIQTQLNNPFIQSSDGKESILQPDDIININDKIYDSNAYKEVSTSSNKKAKRKTYKKIQDDLKETSDVIKEKAEEIIEETNKVKEKTSFNQKTEKAINKTNEKVKSLASKHKGKLITGALFLATAFGYYAGRKNTTVDETLLQDEELGVGESNININNYNQNNIGY